MVIQITTKRKAKMNAKPKILVIDDDSQIRETLDALLCAEGYQVEVAETGKDGIKKTEEKWFNLALIDVRLPDISGTRLLADLKEGTPKMRKIIMTGFPTLPNALDALSKHANAYLIKPFVIPKMLETIKEQLALQADEDTFSDTRVEEYVKSRAKQFLDQQKS